MRAAADDEALQGQQERFSLLDNPSTDMGEFPILHQHLFLLHLRLQAASQIAESRDPGRVHQQQCVNTRHVRHQYHLRLLYTSIACLRCMEAQDDHQTQVGHCCDFRYRTLVRSFIHSACLFPHTCAK